MQIRAGDLRRLIDGLGDNEDIMVTLSGFAMFFNHDKMCPRVDRIDIRWRELRIHLDAITPKEHHGDDQPPQPERP
jgi:hypothetical protein